MKRIIKKGDLNKIYKIKTFNCDHCGCIFEADLGDYKRGSQYNEVYYYVPCPYCNSIVYKDEGED